MCSVVHQNRQELRIFSCLIGLSILLGDMTNLQLPLNPENLMRHIAMDGRSCTVIDLGVIT